jgi:hypothetical protein
MLVQKGAKVRVAREINLQPYTVLKVGEQGEVIDIERDGLAGGPSATVRLDREHSGLKLWDNTAYLTGPDVEALEPARTATTAFARAFAREVCSWKTLAIGAVLGLITFGALEPAIAYSCNLPSTVVHLLHIDDL